ncbi:Protein of unknown function [Gryllus bimaculatus]|nr:Protein of unknown function [Gryllus bimaculatus]
MPTSRPPPLPSPAPPSRTKPVSTRKLLQCWLACATAARAVAGKGTADKVPRVVSGAVVADARGSADKGPPPPTLARQAISWRGGGRRRRRRSGAAGAPAPPSVSACNTTVADSAPPCSFNLATIQETRQKNQPPRRQRRRNIAHEKTQQRQGAGERPVTGSRTRRAFAFCAGRSAPEEAPRGFGRRRRLSRCTMES